MIYVFLADGFEEVEAITTVDIMRRAQLDVKTVGIGSRQVTGSHQITVTADLEDTDLCISDMSAVVLPGGMPGTHNLEKSAVVKKSVQYCMEHNLFICAICAAPSILAHMGLLDGKKATCFPKFACELSKAEVLEEPAVADGRIITGKSAGAAVEFALKAVEKIAGEEISAQVRTALQCP